MCHYSCYLTLQTNHICGMPLLAWYDCQSIVQPICQLVFCLFMEVISVVGVVPSEIYVVNRTLHSFVVPHIDMVFILLLKYSAWPLHCFTYKFAY
jgi:hypothetical protein